MKTFRTIVAFFQALIPFSLFCLLGVLLFLELSAPYHIIFSTLAILIGVIIGRFLFNMMRKRGVIAVMAGSNSTYNLDELTSHPDITVHSPKELAHLFSTYQLNFNKSVTITIWGDWEGRALDKKHQLKSMIYNEELNYLTIWFKNHYAIRVKEAQTIMTSTDYIKIVKAKAIIWQTPSKYQKQNIYHYVNTGKAIKTKSNTTWQPHTLDIGIGMNALYLQG